MEKASKLLCLEFFAEIMDFEKAIDNVHIAGSLRSLRLTSVTDASLEEFFQLKKTLHKLTFKNCKNLTNNGLIFLSSFKLIRNYFLI